MPLEPSKWKRTLGTTQDCIAGPSCWVIGNHASRSWPLVILTLGIPSRSKGLLLHPIARDWCIFLFFLSGLPKRVPTRCRPHPLFGVSS